METGRNTVKEIDPTAWLKKRGCRNSAAVAQKAVDAANSQPTMLATQTMGSALATKLAAEIAIIDHELVDLDAQITEPASSPSKCCKVVGKS
jgi:hypothetical protein